MTSVILEKLSCSALCKEILKIQQTTKEIRQQFKNAFMKYIIEMNKIFQQISQQLKKAHKIKLSHTSIDTFHPAVDDTQTNNMNYSITHGSTNDDAAVCIPEWVFFGIISKHASLKSSLYKASTVYGWAGHHHQYDGFKCEMDINHTVELFIDYDRHKIRLKNESVSLVHEINVSIIKCPLPWILYVGLYNADDQIRLQLA
ncbi:unnamed protein product [Adineta steineri]|uniref:Uncharacterized protein n=1 Tax=Adineta steineri TaxID=433720 RepID=A0A814G3E8_9BILA|nr:unnamed protein product [Adineta steineri]CAF0991242.1 unnamed protein product [Adineta steineri]